VECRQKKQECGGEDEEEAEEKQRDNYERKVKKTANTP